MAESFYLGSGTVNIWVNYNANNLRVQSVEWDNPATATIRARVWNNDVLIYDEVHTGPASGKENVPGNVQLEIVQNPDLPGDELVFPPNITYRFEIVN